MQNEEVGILERGGVGVGRLAVTGDSIESDMKASEFSRADIYLHRLWTTSQLTSGSK